MNPLRFFRQQPLVARTLPLVALGTAVEINMKLIGKTN
jgi:hypothetical protein